ncbi:MAG: glycerophosphodiester phosphodiesterase [Myxococcales bacterium]|nr:glycerophosphodiester phosphodiesterase [Myxococcales bacterium]
MNRLRRRAHLLSALALTLVAGCVHRPRPTDHLFPAPLTAMGHRGASALAPENTMAAFREAAALGVPFELDTRFVGSGELIVLHDDDLERATGAPGKASERSLAELQRLDAGTHFDPAWAGEPIPTLDQVFAELGGKVVINVEVKSVKGTDNKVLAAAVARAIEARGLVDKVIVTSFSPFLLAALRAENPAIARGQLYGTFKDADLNGIEKALLRNLAFNRRALPDVLSVEHVMINARYLKKMHKRGYKVFAWTVNEVADMERLIDLGVDGIITDHPDQLIEVMRRRGLPVPKPAIPRPPRPEQAEASADAPAPDAPAPADDAPAPAPDDAAER